MKDELKKIKKELELIKKNLDEEINLIYENENLLKTGLDYKLSELYNGFQMLSFEIENTFQKIKSEKARLDNEYCNLLKQDVENALQRNENIKSTNFSNTDTISKLLKKINSIID